MIATLVLSRLFQVAGLGEAEVTIAIDNEWQIFRINEMSLFGGTIRGEALLMVLQQHLNQQSTTAACNQQ